MDIPHASFPPDFDGDGHATDTVPDGRARPCDEPSDTGRLPISGAALLSTLMASTNDGVMVTDQDNRILMVNPAFTRVSGFTADEAVGRTPAILRSGRHGSAFYRSMWQALLSDGHWKGEIWNRTKAGDIYVEWLRLFRVVDPETGVVRHVAVFTDITAHRRAKDLERRRARFDALTGLPNRQAFTAGLTAAMEEAGRCGRSLGLIVLNIDNFRRINEHFGHAVGDRVLINVARGLRGRLRSTDLVARLSGDEFAVMVPGVSKTEHLVSLARMLQRVVAAAGEMETPGAALTAAMGLALAPEDGNDPDELLRHAAAAVDEAQKQTTDRIASHSSTAASRTHQRFLLEAALRRATKAGAFALAFQPRVDMRTGALVGTEALLRWTDPQLGPVPPATFIPIAEETGLIGEIGDWVLAHTAAAAAEWRRAGRPAIPFAANVSALQLAQDLVGKIAGLLDHHTLLPAQLQVEVTETAVVSDPDRARGVLSAVRDLGIKVALDDFGTGFATLASLRNLPVDEIKIDRSFITELGRDKADREIVRVVIALGGALDKAIIAEGVETDAQAQELLAMGCHLAQGWHYGRPMPLAELMNLPQPRHG